MYPISLSLMWSFCELIVYFENVIIEKSYCTVYLSTTHSTKLIESLCIALSVYGEISKPILEETGRDDVNLICTAQGACSPDASPTLPHLTSNLQQTKNETTNMVIDIIVASS